MSRSHLSPVECCNSSHGRIKLLEPQDDSASSTADLHIILHNPAEFYRQASGHHGCIQANAESSDFVISPRAAGTVAQASPPND